MFQTTNQDTMMIVFTMCSEPELSVSVNGEIRQIQQFYNHMIRY